MTLLIQSLLCIVVCGGPSEAGTLHRPDRAEAKDTDVGEREAGRRRDGPTEDPLRPGAASGEEPGGTTLPPMPGPPAEQRPPGAPTARPGQARGRQTPRPRVERKDKALLVPRVILFVPHIVLWGVFWPFSKLLNLVDDPVLARMRQVFFWNEAQTLGWYPLLSFQSGYGFTFGARIFHDDLFGHDELLTFESRAGGLYSQIHELHFRGLRLGGAPVWLDLRGRYDVQPRLIFAGLGDPPLVPRDSDNLGPRRGAVQTRYRQTRGLASVWLGYNHTSPLATVLPGVGTIYNRRRFGRDRSRPAYLITNEDDPSIEEVYDISLIPGFSRGVDVVQVLGSIAVDGRDRPGSPSSGYYFRVLGGGAPPQWRDVAFWRYGTELSGYFNFFHASRVLVLRGALEGVHGEHGAIPFSELPRLGGPHRLRGYRLGRFRDRKALLGTVEYRYPIHQVIGGHLFVDVGRIAPRYQELFSPEHPWRVGYGGGFRFRTPRRLFFRVDLAYGREFMVFFSTDALQAFTDEYMLEL